MTRHALPLAAILTIPVPANAQPSVATMTMTANGQATATIAPGETINLRATLSWTNGPQTGGGPTQNVFAAIKGNINVSPNLGTPSNFSSDFSPSNLVNLGTFSGASRLGMDIQNPPDFFGQTFIIPPFAYSAGIKVASYDLTLSTPGIYTLNWTPDIASPLLLVYPGIPFINFVSVPTTYLPATITVTPTPASILFLLAASAPRRTRTGARP